MKSTIVDLFEKINTLVEDNIVIVDGEECIPVGLIRKEHGVELFKIASNIISNQNMTTTEYVDVVAKLNSIIRMPVKELGRILPSPKEFIQPS